MRASFKQVQSRNQCGARLFVCQRIDRVNDIGEKRDTIAMFRFLISQHDPHAPASAFPSYDGNNVIYP